MAQKNIEKNLCSIPECINSADYLNYTKNANTKPFAIFTPTSVKNVNEWSSIFGLNLTMRSRVCEEHFNSEDILSHDIFAADTGLRKIKSLKYNAMPLKIKKYENPLKQYSGNDSNENIKTNKTKKNAENTKTFSTFDKLFEDKATQTDDIVMKFETVDLLSNIAVDDLKENNLHSSLGEIHSKMPANNSMFILFQPSAQQSTQVSKTKSNEVTNVIDGVNQDKELVEDHSITSQNDFVKSNLSLSFEWAMPKETKTDCLLTKVDEKCISANQSTKLTKPACETKPETFDNVLQMNSTVSAGIPSQPNVEHVFSYTPFKNFASMSYQQIINESILASTSVKMTSQSFQNNNFLIPTVNYPSCSNALIDDIIAAKIRNSEFNESKLDVSKDSDNPGRTALLDSDLYGTEDPRKFLQSNSSNNVLRNKVKSDEDMLFIPGEPGALKNFIRNSNNVTFPNKFWKSIYCANLNTIIFIHQNSANKVFKRIFFNNSFVPDIFINGKMFNLKKTIKTMSDVRNVIEEVDEIMSCSGIFTNETCIGYVINISEENKLCRNCKNLKKKFADDGKNYKY